MFAESFVFLFGRGVADRKIFSWGRITVPYFFIHISVIFVFGVVDDKLIWVKH